MKDYTSYFWLSFVDPDKPSGERFLGATIVAASNISSAADEAWRVGINPGGEVSGFPITTDNASFRKEWVNRLIGTKELNEAGVFSVRERKQPRH
jgi:hypothetical protein